MDQRIPLQTYPQLRQVAQHMATGGTVTPEEALALYERHWRHIDREHMIPRERALLEQLIRDVGHGHLAV
jgi:hypothetical protein